MIEKGLSASSADLIGTYVQRQGTPAELLPKLLVDASLKACERAATGLRELEVLFEYAKTLQALEHVRLDLSLARGLDYYTGVIFEAIVPRLS